MGQELRRGLSRPSSGSAMRLKLVVIWRLHWGRKVFTRWLTHMLTLQVSSGCGQDASAPSQQEPLHRAPWASSQHGTWLLPEWEPSGSYSVFYNSALEVTCSILLVSHTRPLCCRRKLGGRCVYQENDYHIMYIEHNHAVPRTCSRQEGEEMIMARASKSNRRKPGTPWRPSTGSHAAIQGKYSWCRDGPTWRCQNQGFWGVWRTAYWPFVHLLFREGNGNLLKYSCLESPVDGGARWATVHGVAKSRTRLSDFTFTFHFHALEKEMATHSSVLTWRIPGMGEPGGLPSMRSHRVGHDRSNLASSRSILSFAKRLFKSFAHLLISYFWVLRAFYMLWI